VNQYGKREGHRHRMLPFPNRMASLGFKGGPEFYTDNLDKSELLVLEEWAKVEPRMWGPQKTRSFPNEFANESHWGAPVLKTCAWLSSASPVSHGDIAVMQCSCTAASSHIASGSSTAVSCIPLHPCSLEIKEQTAYHMELDSPTMRRVDIDWSFSSALVSTVSLPGSAVWLPYTSALWSLRRSIAEGQYCGCFQHSRSVGWSFRYITCLHCLLQCSQYDMCSSWDSNPTSSIAVLLHQPLDQRYQNWGVTFPPPRLFLKAAETVNRPPS
jgi:hypothetical protein